MFVKKLRKLLRNPKAFFVDSIFLRSCYKNKKRQNNSAINNNDLVSVIITSYNAERFIKKSILSIIHQTYKNIEIVVVDDASTDRTLSILEGIQAEYSERVIRVFKSPINHGTYWCKNYGIIRANGRFITFHDSDDTSLNSRISNQINVFYKYEKHNMLANVVMYSRRDKNNQIIAVNGNKMRKAFITLFFEKDLVDQIGFFDTVRFGADSEFYHRINSFAGRNGVRIISQDLYYALYDQSSLTMSGSSAFVVDKQNANSIHLDLSQNRRIYSKSFKNWHTCHDISDKGQKITFPQIQRRFPVPKDMLVSYPTDDTLKVQEISNSQSSMYALYQNQKRKIISVIVQAWSVYEFTVMYNSKINVDLFFSVDGAINKHLRVLHYQTSNVAIIFTSNSDTLDIYAKPSSNTKIHSKIEIKNFTLKLI